MTIQLTMGRASLGARIIRASSWSMFGHLIGHALRLGSSLLMTRLLVPEMFGVIGLAAVVQSVITLLSDIGLRQAIIQSPQGDTPELLNTAWTLQAIRGGVVFLACLGVAAAIWVAAVRGWMPAGSVYTAHELPAVIAFSGLSAAILGFQSTKAITSDRNLDLRKIVLIELAAQVVGLIVMTMLAYTTRSIWSIVFGGVVGAAVTVLLTHSWLRGTRNRFMWHRESLRELMGYGRWVLISSSVYVLAVNIDRLLLGGWIDAKTLGLYVLALNLASVIEGAGARLFGSVAMPALSEVARTDRSRFAKLYFRLRLPFDVAYVGSAGILFACSEWLVHLLYDPRYAQAGHMLGILSFGLLFSRFGMANNAYLALGEPKALTWINSVKLASLGLLMPLGWYLGGMNGALIAIALHMLPTVPLMIAINRRFELNDIRFELATLLVWPLGYGLGYAVMFIGRL